MRGYLKSVVASAAHLSRADRLALAVSRGEPLVLGYHRVVADYARETTYSFPSMLISAGMLERHLDWVARRFHVVSLEEISTQIGTRARVRRPLAAITFDDGYRDVYEHAFPLLTRKGLPATVFVATDYIGTARVFPHDALYLLLLRAFRRWRSFSHQLLSVLRRLELPLPAEPLAAASTSAQAALRILLTTLPAADVQRVISTLEVDCGMSGGVPNGFRPMTWDMVAEMRGRGIAIGSHTKSHALLTNEAGATVNDEIDGSQEVLTARLGRPATCFAYPDGHFDAAAVRAVAAAGYRVGVTTCRHRDRDYPGLTVPRIVLWERSSVNGRGEFAPAVFSCQTSGLFNRFSPCRGRHRAAVRHGISHGERHNNARGLQRTESVSER